jgi:hypothetical protein
MGINLQFLPEEILIQIYSESGELSKLAQTCQTNRALTDAIAQRILDQLKDSFGNSAVVIAFIHLAVKDKSSSAKVDALFHAAKIKDPNHINSVNPYSIEQLKGFMSPFIELKSTTLLWVVLLSNGPLSLRQKMASIKLGQDPLIRLSQMQTFLRKNANELTFFKSLDLSNKGLVTLPKEIGLFVSLTELNLSGNQLQTLPEEIGQLKQLTILNVDNNRLGDLPETIGNLNHLQCLYLYNNQISHFPKGIGGMQSLQILSAAKNRLIVLPDEIGSLKQLQILILDFNFLKTLPGTCIHLENLEELHVNNNQLLRLPVLPALRFLGCEGNLFVPSEGGVDSIDEERFNCIYQLIGNEKWKECIDGTYHNYGPDVFDLGLHGGAVEPGFLASMLHVFQFLPKNYHRRVDAAFYLDLHKVACSHFQGASTQTVIGQEKVGVFREEVANADFLAPYYAFTQDAINEFNALNIRLAQILGPSFSLGEIVIISLSPLTWRIHYKQMTSEQVAIVFNLFLSEFYADMQKASIEDDKLMAIAKFIQHLEWLHPPQDGCGRIDTALLNFLLTKYGFNPVILQFPYVSSCRGLVEWITWLRKGMDQWWDTVENQKIDEKE